MRIAILCSGLGHVRRGHEVFVRQVFDLLAPELDITLFKGGGEASEREVVVPHLPRYSPLLDGMRVVASARWKQAVEEDERLRIETTTFAYGALPALLEGDYDIVHCLEREVCDLVYEHRLLFRKPPRVVFANGGALIAARLPRCDFVQEHTRYSMERGAPDKSFLVPHGVDLALFDPARDGGADFRAEMDLPQDALVVLSVGTICHSHKRMDHLIEEVAQVDGAYLVVIGQDAVDSDDIRALGAERLGERVRFSSMPHGELWRAYAAADVFALGSLFETFGIVYLEAMAMRLPVIATQHENQRAIIEHGVFVDMERRGAVADALRNLDPAERERLGRLGRERVEQHFDLRSQVEVYRRMYERVAVAPVEIPSYGWRDKVRGQLGRLLGR